MVSCVKQAVADSMSSIERTIDRKLAAVGQPENYEFKRNGNMKQHEDNLSILKAM